MIINGNVYSILDLFTVSNLLYRVVQSSLLWPFMAESIGLSLISETDLGLVKSVVMTNVFFNYYQHEIEIKRLIYVK